MIVLGLQSYLTFSLALFLIAPLGQLGHWRRLGVLAGLTVLGALPLVHGMSLAGYLRGLTDDLACTSVIWLIAGALMRLGYIAAWPRSQLNQLWVCFAGLGVILFPAAMGVGMVDTYGWGFSPRPMLLAMGGLTLLMILLRNGPGTLLLLAATAAFMLDIKPSDNYWDYLLDPFIFLYSLGALGFRAVSWMASRKASFTQRMSPDSEGLADTEPGGRTRA